MSKGKVIHPHQRSPFMHVDESGYWPSDIGRLPMPKVRSCYKTPGVTWTGEIAPGGCVAWMGPGEGSRRVLEGID